jgi:hypothetical protein
MLSSRELTNPRRRRPTETRQQRADGTALAGCADQESATLRPPVSSASYPLLITRAFSSDHYRRLRPQRFWRNGAELGCQVGHRPNYRCTGTTSVPRPPSLEWSMTSNVGWSRYELTVLGRSVASSIYLLYPSWKNTG